MGSPAARRPAPSWAPGYGVGVGLRLGFVNPNPNPNANPNPNPNPNANPNPRRRDCISCAQGARLDGRARSRHLEGARFSLLPLARDGARSDGVWAGERAVWGGCGLGGCAGGVRGCATAVCRETRAEHDAAAINAGPIPPGCCRPRTLSSHARGNTREGPCLVPSLSAARPSPVCRVRVRARMSNKSTSQCSQSQIVR